jgi:hypothetical protein
MRSSLADRAHEENYVTPHELNAELAELVGAYHGIDRDNVPPGTLTAAKVALDAWNVIEVQPRATPRQTTTSDSRTTGVSAGVPDDAGTGTWSLRITTGDGLLEVGASVAVVVASPVGAVLGLSLGIRIDGDLVAWAPEEKATVEGCPLVDGCKFVSAGEHLVEVVFSGGNPINEWRDGLLWARGVSR